MIRVPRIIKNWLIPLIAPRPLIGLFYFPKYFIQYVKFLSLPDAPKLLFSDLQPCLGDWTFHTPFDAHYFYQGAWLSRKLASIKPANHVDIASSVLMISVLSGYIDTTFVDYRPLKTNISGLKSIRGDILNLDIENNSVASLSCLHVIEHVGLGRYGDQLDVNGSIKASKELERIVAMNGDLFLSVPIGKERVCFNAHRVFLPMTILNMFPQLVLVDFSYVDDSGSFHQNADLEIGSSLDYGCGMFHFKKTQD